MSVFCVLCVCVWVCVGDTVCCVSLFCVCVWVGGRYCVLCECVLCVVCV